MRFSLLTAATLVAPTVVSAAGQLGWALGSQNPDDTCKSQADYEADFKAIAANSGSKLVRGYAASQCEAAANILPAAKAQGFQVMLGIWPYPGDDKPFNDDLAAITEQAGKYADQIYAVTVASEALYRKEFTSDELAALIDKAKAGLKKATSTPIKVGTADSWNKFADGTGNSLISHCDIVLVNAFAFWQGFAVDNATETYFSDIISSFNHIKDIAGDNVPELWTGETGWPTDGGSDFGAAEAGTQNAKQFYQTAFCGMINWGFNAFFFEAFDEPWKPDSIGDNGKAANEKNWGAMKSDRSLKFDLDCSKKIKA